MNIEQSSSGRLEGRVLQNSHIAYNFMYVSSFHLLIFNADKTVKILRYPFVGEVDNVNDN